MNITAKIFLGLSIHEGVQQVRELDERHKVFAQARAYADEVKKPLLVVGKPKWTFSHPCGDVTIDINPNGACEVETADVRDIPYPDQFFGAAFASHILEHLPTIPDAVTAINELERVADKLFVTSPHKSSFIAWIYPGHHLWVTSSRDGYIIEQRGNGQPRSESLVVSLMVA